MTDDVTAYRKAIRELLAALPHCELVKANGRPCFATATRESFTGHGFHAEYLCDEHGAGEDGLFWDDAVRKAQALMAPPEETAPACVDRDVFKALEKDGVQFATFTSDGAGRRVAEVDMGPAGRATFRIESSDTTETLVAKVRAQLGHRIGVSAGVECPACCSTAEHEHITIGALDGSTTHRCKCGMTWATKETPL